MVTSYNSRNLAKVWPGIVCSITCPNKNTPKCVKAVIYLTSGFQQYRNRQFLFTQSNLLVHSLGRVVRFHEKCSLRETALLKWNSGPVSLITLAWSSTANDHSRSFLFLSTGHGLEVVSRHNELCGVASVTRGQGWWSSWDKGNGARHF